MALSLFKKREKLTSEDFSDKNRLDPYTAAEIRAGFLVTVSFLTLLCLVFMAGNLQLFKPTQDVRIMFNYISGLSKNAPVHFAGHEVGRVTAIRLLNQDQGQVSVTARISKEVVLRSDSQAFIEMMGFMGEKFLEITPGSAGAPLLAENGAIPGTDPIAFTAIMKRGTEISDELQKTTVSLQGLIKNLDDTVGGNQSQVKEIIGNLNETSRNVKEMTEDLKTHPWKLLRKGKEEKPDEKKKRRFFF